MIIGRVRKMISVSIITTTYNDPKNVETCRGALRNHTLSWLPCSRGAGNRRLTERSGTAARLRGPEVSRSDGKVRELALVERLRGREVLNK